VNTESNKEWMIPVVERARELVGYGLCRDMTACDKRNNPIAFDSEKAARFSLCGALHRAERDCKVSPQKHGHTTLFFRETIGKDLTPINEAATGVRELQSVCDSVLSVLRQKLKKADA
jgi:hypothetical protein